MSADGPPLLEDSATSTYREWVPPVAGHVVRCWWEQRVGDGGYDKRVLPDGYADVIVSADGRGVVAGPTTSLVHVALAPGAHLRGVRLRSAVVSAVLGCPAVELRGATVDLAEVVSRDADEVADAIWAGRTPARFCGVAPDPRTTRAVGLLRGRAQVSVSSVATEVGLSTRQLRRLSAAHTGLGPKSLQRVARLQWFLDGAARARSGTTLAELAAAAGYADQAHLNHDVRELAGTTPGDLWTSHTQS